MEPDASSGRIYDANRPMLAALAKTSGVDDVLDLGRRADEPGALASLVAGARGGCDVLVTSGGCPRGTGITSRRFCSESTEVASKVRCTSGG